MGGEGLEASSMGGVNRAQPDAGQGPRIPGLPWPPRIHAAGASGLTRRPARGHEHPGPLGVKQCVCAHHAAARTRPSAQLHQLGGVLPRRERHPDGWRCCFWPVRSPLRRVGPGIRERAPGSFAPPTREGRGELLQIAPASRYDCRRSSMSSSAARASTCIAVAAAWPSGAATVSTTGT